MHKLRREKSITLETSTTRKGTKARLRGANRCENAPPWRPEYSAKVKKNLCKARYVRENNHFLFFLQYALQNPVFSRGLASLMQLEQNNLSQFRHLYTSPSGMAFWQSMLAQLSLDMCCFLAGGSSVLSTAWSWSFRFFLSWVLRCFLFGRLVDRGDLSLGAEEDLLNSDAAFPISNYIISI